MARKKSSELAVIYRKPSELTPWSKNPKKHNTDALRSSVARYGARQPIIVQRGTNRIIAGHGRLEAYVANGMQEVPVLEWDCTDEEAAQYAVADNQLTIAGGWDDDLLADIIRDWDTDVLKTLGFDDDTLSDLLGDQIIAGMTDDDAVPEQAPAVAKRGQVWRLGEHRVMCGDSTSAEDFKALMAGAKADMVFTDPPYCVGYQAKQIDLNQRIGGDRLEIPVTADALALEDTAKIWKAAFANLYANTDEKASYYCTAPQGGDQMMMMMIDALWQVKHELIWVKDSLVLGRADYHYKHEPILFGWKKGKTHNFYGDRKSNSVWEFPRPKASKLHPTMKPVELVERAINNSSMKGQSVLDPFLGSGTTVIACEKTGRVCYGMEIDAHYIDIIIKRFEDYTGKKAVLVE